MTKKRGEGRHIWERNVGRSGQLATYCNRLGRQQQMLQQISKFKENWMLVLNYDNVIFSFIFDISWGHIQLTTHMITLWLHSWTCSGTSLWSNWEPGNMVMNPLIISAQHHLYSPTRGKFVFIIPSEEGEIGLLSLIWCIPQSHPLWNSLCLDFYFFLPDN